MKQTDSESATRATEEDHRRLRAVWLSAGLLLFFVAFEKWILQTRYEDYLLETYQRNGLFSAVVRLAGLLTVASLQLLYFWNSLVSSWPWRMFYGLVFTAVVFIEYGYVRATGGMFNAQDFHIALGAWNMWGVMAATHVNWLAVIPSAVHAAALMTARPQRGNGNIRRLAAVVLITVAVHSTYALTHEWKARGRYEMEVAAAAPMVTFQDFARSAVTACWNKLFEFRHRLRHGPRHEVSFRSNATPSHHVVLIVDESVRADHLSLNGYHRPTTPFLQELARDGRLINWGVASSATPLSNDTVACILTGIDTLPDVEYRAATQPTVFQYAKAMNFGTHLLDGGTRQARFGPWKIYRQVDDWRTQDHFGNDADTDFRMARAAAQLLDAQAGQFVVLLKRGNHLPYEWNAPLGAMLWTPHLNGTVLEDSDMDDALVNTYDNGIQYNIDSFFRHLLGTRGARERTVILYTSDHGQVLTDNRKDIVVRNSTWGEAAVPLFLLAATPPLVDTAYRASHYNIFATLLDLMGFPETQRRFDHRRSLLKARAADVDRRNVFQGAFFGFGKFFIQDFDAMVPPSAE